MYKIRFWVETDASSTEVDATGNWWDSEDGVEISERIYGYDDPDALTFKIGVVRWRD